MDLPAWSVTLAAAWGLLAALLLVLDRVRGGETPVCLFRRVTGVRCVACGGMHTVAALAQGDVALALSTNPLVALAVPLAVAWAGLRLAAGRRLRLSAPERRAWCIVLVAAGALNWAYVAARG